MGRAKAPQARPLRGPWHDDLRENFELHLIMKYEFFIFSARFVTWNLHAALITVVIRLTVLGAY